MVTRMGGKLATGVAGDNLPSDLTPLGRKVSDTGCHCYLEENYWGRPLSWWQEVNKSLLFNKKCDWPLRFKYVYKPYSQHLTVLTVLVDAVIDYYRQVACKSIVDTPTFNILVPYLSHYYRIGCERWSKADNNGRDRKSGITKGEPAQKWTWISW